MKYLLLLLLCLVGVGCSSGGKPTPIFSEPFDASSDSVADVAQIYDDTGMEESSTTPPNPPDGGWLDGSFDLSYVENLPIIYRGGSVMTQPVDVYYIWYGNWIDANTTSILEEFMRNLGTSPWYQIDTAYYQQIGVTPILSDSGTGEAGDAGLPKIYVTSQINFVKSVSVGYTRGTTLQDSDISGIVGDAITANLVPADPNAVYFVLTSADVQEATGFCYQYCGWHSNYIINNQNLHVAFIGDTGFCEWCNLKEKYAEAGVPTSPNNDWSADSMASVIAHELVESVTNPNPNDTTGYSSWVDYDGEEVGDKCAWTFGQPFETPNKSVANVTIGNRNYMIQQNWVLDIAGGRCDLHL